MKRSLTPDEVGLSIAYVFILIVLFVLIDLGFIWLLNNVILDVFNWFNHLSIFWKLFLLVIGAGSLLMMAFYICSGIASLIGYFIFKHIPTNLFTQIAGGIIAIGNSIYLIIKLWQLPTRFNFWVVVELLILSVVAWAFAAVARTKKEYEEGYTP
jgi:hypothetical protein